MKSYFKIFISVILFFVSVNAQDGIFKGKVLNEKNNKGLSGVNIIFNGAQIHATTGSEGEFKIEDIPAGNYSVSFSYVGYKTESIRTNIGENKTVTKTIYLKQTAVQLGDVTVSSPKYVTMVKDVPMPMDVVNKDEILKEPSFTTSDLLKNKPGISLVRDGIWATTVSIRGLSRANIVTMVNGDRIETASDLAAAMSMIDLNDIERIEVIKGAASSLYGTGALGGVVNFITKSGTYSDQLSLSGSLMGGYNSVNEGNSNSLSLQASGSRWYAKVIGSLTNAGNISTPNGKLANSQYHDNSVSASAGIKIFSNNELRFNYQKYSAKDVGIPGGAPLFPSQAEVSYPTEKRDLFSAEYSIKNISNNFKNLSLKYYNQNVYRDVKNIPHMVQSVPASNGQPAKQINVLSITPNARHYTNGIQLQTNWVFAKKHILVAGIDAWQRSLDSRREKNLLINVLKPDGSIAKSINQTVGERPLPIAEYRSVGVYAQDDYTVIENKLSVNIGGRFDQINVNNNAVSNPVYLIVDGARNTNPPNQVLNWSSRNAKDVSWSGNLGILYKLVNNVDLSLNVARSFRSPSLEERYQYIDLGSLIRLGNPDLKPEKGFFTDLGLRIWQNNFSFNGSVFLNNLTDLVVEKPGTYEGRAAAIKTNVGKAQLYGFDLSAEYNFYRNFTVYGSASYVRGKDTELNQDLPQIPPLNGRLGVRTMVADLFNIDLSSVIFAEQNKIAEGEIATPGYATFNLYFSSVPVELNLASLRLVAGVENILNKEYRNHLSTNRGLVTAEPGRNVFVKLKVNF